MNAAIVFILVSAGVSLLMMMLSVSFLVISIIKQEFSKESENCD